MPRNVLSDVQPASFRDVDFMAQVLEWNDGRKQRLAVHEYLKRDGAEIEPMGRAPHRVRFSLVYIGTNWRKDYQRLVAAVDANPKGLLVHPFFGSMQAACEGFDGVSVNAESGIDTINVPVSFIEDAVDQRLDSPTGTPAAKATEANTYSAKLSAFSSVFPKAATAIGLAQKAFAALTTAASAIANGGPPDPALNRLFADASTNATAARSAILADPNAATKGATAYEAMATLEQALAACAELDDALKAAKPVLFTYTVPATASLLSIAQAHYQGEAWGRLGEIQANNPGVIRNLAAVQAGTQLLLVTPR